MARNLALELLQLYRVRLSEGALQSPESERSLYALHQKALGELEESMSRNAREAVSRILQTERRAFGWSFLSGPVGEQVESAFHKLAAELEQQT